MPIRNILYIFPVTNLNRKRAIETFTSDMPTMTIIEWKKIQCHILIVSGKEIDRADYQITIYSASANFSIDNPSFGAVESASIQLRGRLGPAECTYIKGIANGTVKYLKKQSLKAAHTHSQHQVCAHAVQKERRVLDCQRSGLESVGGHGLLPEFVSYAN
jgi:hypothetical protein